eukprot:gene20318-22318_t
MANNLQSSSRPNFWTEVHPEATEIVDDIIKETENYLTQVFGYPKSFLFVLAKASFGYNASPIVSYDIFTKRTWEFMNKFQDMVANLSPVSSEVTINTGNSSCFNDITTQTENDEKGNNLVQISATSQEIKRRIDAFIKQKRQEVDTYNRREFCVFQDDETDATCARTDATYVPRHGKKSLLKTYRIYNKLDPSLANGKMDTKDVSRRRKFNGVWEPSHPCVKLSLKHLPPETYERIENIQMHLTATKQQLCKQGNDDKDFDLVGKIKDLENRILFLEGISPEYFHYDFQDTRRDKRQHPYKSKHTRLSKKVDVPDNDYDSLNKRISELKQTLYKSSKPS